MKVKNLDLVNYRNYKNFSDEFHPKMNIIVGDNAQGKTNLIESLYLLSTTRSFRINKDSNLIKKNCEFALIESDIESNILKKLKIVIVEKGKSLFISNKKISKNSDFIGVINTVLFSPKDIEIFSSSKSSRRKLINLEIGKISKKYLNSLNYYQSLLKDRNILLKKNEVDFFLIKSIDEKMIENQIQIVRFRKHFIDFINSKINRYYSYLSNSSDSITIEYDCCINNFSNIKVEFENLYKNSLEKDKLYKMTMNGIHREDILFKLNSNNVNEFASQGQRRIIILSLKFAIIEYIENSINDYPILLLDDVLSELDINVKQRLFKIINGKLQVFITSTDIKEIDINTDYKLFNISHGEVLKGSN
jgi:DNA replication and repair protein RecF